MKRYPRDQVFGLPQSNIGGRRTEIVHHALVLYAEVDYIHRKGLGIGIVQRTDCRAKNGFNRVLKTEERKFGIKRENFRAENVKTLQRACMLALLHALGLASSTLANNGGRSVQLEEVKVMISASTVVQTVNEHVQDFSRSSEHVRKTNDRPMIKRVVDAVRRLSRRGFES